MIILEKPITRAQAVEMASMLYIDMINAVADVEEGLLAIDAELHSDLEKMLLENGSLLENLWGFNIYPELEGDDFIEFDSLINIRPRQNNGSRNVEDGDVRKKIVDITNRFIV